MSTRRRFLAARSVAVTLVAMVIVAAVSLAASPVTGTARAAASSSAFLTLLHTDIVAPSSELELGPVVRFRVLTPRDVRSFSARLGGHNVTRSFHRVSSDMYVGRVRWHGLLRPGATSLTVASTSRTGQRSADARPFVLASRTRGYLTVRGFASRSYRSGSRIVIALRRPAAVINVRLAGRLVTKAFSVVTRHGRERLVGRLAADDGLRFGVNRLSIFAGASDGPGGSFVRGLRVSRLTALVSAGADRGTVAGETVRLNAGATRAGHPGDRLTYRWKLVSRPAHSHAQISNPTAMRPRLRTDEPGAYDAQVTVTQAPQAPGATHSAPSSDVAEVAATPSAGPIGVPVSVGTGGITFNGTLYPFGGASVIALALNRETLGVAGGAAINLGTNPVTAAQTLGNLGNSDVVVVATKPGSNIGVGWSFPLGVIGASVDSFGGLAPADFRLARGGWSAVGVPGSTSGGDVDIPTGGGYDTGAALGGHFEVAAGIDPPDYAFVQGDYASFDTQSASTPTTDTMLLDGTSYTSNPLPSGCSGGLYMVILAAHDLQETFGTTIATNCTDPSVAQQGLQAMDSELHNQVPEYVTQGRHLVFVQTIGATPWSSDSAVEQARYQVGLDLSGLDVHTGNGAPASLDFGATAGVFDSATGAYGLAGFDGFGEPGSIVSHGVETAESSSNTIGAVSGLLRRDDQSDYEPILGGPALPVTSSEPTGVSGPMSLPAIANHAPTPWPTDSLPGSAAIIDYIATQVLSGPGSGIANSPFADPSVSNGACDDPVMPDVRSEYCNIGFVRSTNWSTAIMDLSDVKDSPPAQFTADGDWTQIVTQLISEMNIVSSVDSYVIQTQATLTDANTGLPIALKSIVAQVDTVLKPPAAAVSSGAPGYWTDFASDLASLFGSAQDIVGVGESKYVTGIGALGFVLGDLLQSPNGQPQLESSIPQTEVANLATDTFTRYQAMIPAIGQFGSLVVSDWGKLQAFSASGLDDFSSNDEAALGVGISLSAARFAWGQLLPTVYNLDQTFNGAGPNPNSPPGADQFECYQQSSFGPPSTYRPFGPKNPTGPASAADQDVVPIPSQQVNGFPDTAQTYVLAGPGDPSTGGQSYNDNQVVHPALPPASITNLLFNPAAGSLGNITALGENPAEFFEQTFTTPRFINCY